MSPKSRKSSLNHGSKMDRISCPGNGSSTTTNSPKSNPIQTFFLIISCSVQCCIWLIISLPFFVSTHFLSIFLGRPPKLQLLQQTIRYFGFVSKLDFPAQRKVELWKSILVHQFQSPIFGFMWILDEIFYGRQLNNLSAEQQRVLENSVFVISGFRSASTSLARQMHSDVILKQNDECKEETQLFVGSTSTMAAHPYLWLWKLIYWIVGDIPDIESSEDDVITRQYVRERFNSSYSEEFLKRHHNDPFQIDTFDGSFLSCHLNGHAWQFLSARNEKEANNIVINEFNYAVQQDQLNQTIWKKMMVNHIDRLARKTILFHGNVTKQQRFLMKGHMLSIADQLQAKYPNAKFVTLVRSPLDKLKSQINYMAVNPSVCGSSSIPWNGLVNTLAEMEKQYCEVEMEWYGDSKSGAKLVVSFDEFVKDQSKCIGEIASWLEEGKGKVGLKSSALVSNKLLTKASKKKQTSATVKSSYGVDRSLAEFRFDEKQFKLSLKDYIDWMKSIGSDRQRKTR